MSPGAATVKLAALDKNGGEHEPTTIQVTANKIGFEVESVPGVSAALGNVSPIFDPAEHRVTVEGGGNMADFSVEWTLNNPRGRLDQTRTGFTRQGGRWVAANRVNFDGGLQHAGTVVFVSAQVIRNRDGAVVGSVGFPPTRAMFLVKDMRFVFKGTNIGVAALDLFVPKPSSKLADIELQFTRGDGVRDVLFPSLVRINQQGLPSVSFTNKGVSMAFTTPSGGANVGSAGVGTATVTAELASDFSSPNKRAAPVGSNVRDQMQVTLNRLDFVRRGSGPSEEFVLQVFGPANLGNFTARWRLSSGATQTTTFTSSGAGGESALPVSAGNPLQVDVLNGSGRVVGTLSATGSGRPIGEPKMTLKMPRTATPGQAVILSVTIDNIRFDDAFDFRCKWTADAAFGKLDNAQSNVSPLTGDRGICVNTLRLNDNLTNVGKANPISVRLVRQVGPAPRG